MDESDFLNELESLHLSRMCTDTDCWCRDPQYYVERYGDDS
jgi:hypothetical protein